MSKLEPAVTGPVALPPLPPTGALPATVAVATAPAGEQRFVLHDIDWDTYIKVSDALDERNVRFTFDRGRLEIMTKSGEHETWSRLLYLLVFVLVEESGQNCRSCGSMTCRRQILDRGLEPDECFYITHESQMRGRKPIDLDTDPPPDLAVEVDVTRNSAGRMPIYAALRVPEVWRFDSESTVIYQLGDSGEYTAAPQSRYFTFLSAEAITAVLGQWGTATEVSLIRSFRQWVRDQIGTAS
jgi:Uma2 family endonuclease